MRHAYQTAMMIGFIQKIYRKQVGFVVNVVKNESKRICDREAQPTAC